MGWKNRLHAVFDLPEEAQDVPTITWVGQGKMTLQGRHRLIVCETTHAVFATTCGALSVEGENLFIEGISADETTVGGKIAHIGYRNG